MEEALSTDRSWLDSLTESAIAELGTWLFDPDAPRPEAVPDDRVGVGRGLFSRLFLKSPAHELTAVKESQFAQLLEVYQTEGASSAYSLPYPKWEFFHYLTSRCGFLLHGSGRSLASLEPSGQEDWNGRRIEAVFATSDPIWPVFFALLDWSALTGSIRNGGFLIEPKTNDEERFYFFSVNPCRDLANVLKEGTVHVVAAGGFRSRQHAVRFDEWHSSGAVKVIARVNVGPEDFPFRAQIARHAEAESIHASWLLYKKRIEAE